VDAGPALSLATLACPCRACMDLNHWMRCVEGQPLVPDARCTICSASTYVYSHVDNVNMYL
jgi:hypothetical protein